MAAKVKETVVPVQNGASWQSGLPVIEIKWGPYHLEVNLTTGTTDMIRLRLLRKIVPELKDDMTPDERDLRNQKINFAYSVPQSTLIKGFDFSVPSGYEDTEELERIFWKWNDLPSQLLAKWERAVNSVERLAEAGELPPEYLTEEQRKDPN